MRQTNIVWVGMALGTTVIDKFVSQTLPFIKGNEKYGKSEHIYTFKASEHTTEFSIDHFFFFFVFSYVHIRPFMAIENF